MKDITWLTSEKIQLLTKMNVKCDLICLYNKQDENSPLTFAPSICVDLTASDCDKMLRNLLEKKGKKAFTTTRETTQYYGKDVLVSVWGFVYKTTEQLYLLRIAYKEGVPLQALLYKELSQGQPSTGMSVSLPVSSDPVVQYLQSKFIESTNEST